MHAGEARANSKQCLAEKEKRREKSSKPAIHHLMKDRAFELTDIVRETAFQVRRYFGTGHLEKVYENSLAHRLKKRGLKVEQQKQLVVRDENGFVVGEYFADLVIEDVLILELKAVKALADEHVAQILGYLRATGMEHGALINFGAAKFQIRKLSKQDATPPSGIRRFVQALCALF